MAQARWSVKHLKKEGAILRPKEHSLADECSFPAISFVDQDLPIAALQVKGAVE
jgi:hypothetical protein